MEFAYHASHEQFSPSQLLRYAQLSEQAGFDAIHSSDHFHPWSERQGQSGFAFAWIAAAMQSTGLPFSMVCAPGQRYHPAIVAQAIATIGEMFPSRYSIELGSGEAVNECITGEPWPEKDQRNQRLLESVSIIRELLDGRTVNASGMINVKDATLYTRPSVIPPLFCAAISEETSGWAGSWADGLITTAGEPDEVANKINAFYNGGGKGKPIYLQFCFSYGETTEEAIDGAYDQWRSNLVPVEILAGLRTPQQFDKAATDISVEDVKKNIEIVTGLESLASLFNAYEKLGVDRLILHNVNTNQERFISKFKSWKQGVSNSNKKFTY
ncbi:TIGR03885 family FMN-dependent LLM class oxidoreductase [Terrimonas sp. NA20]|uniref:TIGR03885 family FMN-dependent LLM class oxidoreductase n=1 Tax=Terrimonas ginsenosidimutans TaxID=2908004 RepID=A0ABS9KMK5_9BACT|nr:TIGR03885 family FMN-dependent LLM class oxidoreductase [Terrimonas ginsenosidimutans]MCG2613558.1 TIGR03885 family FMN-dependent LLM class oxidoreductase [Terrimonas ginsenosidimutans]